MSGGGYGSNLGRGQMPMGSGPMAGRPNANPGLASYANSGRDATSFSGSGGGMFKPFGAPSMSPGMQSMGSPGGMLKTYANAPNPTYTGGNNIFGNVSPYPGTRVEDPTMSDPADVWKTDKNIPGPFNPLAPPNTGSFNPVMPSTRIDPFSRNVPNGNLGNIGDLQRAQQPISDPYREYGPPGGMPQMSKPFTVNAPQPAQAQPMQQAPQMIPGTNRPMPPGAFIDEYGIARRAPETPMNPAAGQLGAYQNPAGDGFTGIRNGQNIYRGHLWNAQGMDQGGNDFTNWLNYMGQFDGRR